MDDANFAALGRAQARLLELLREQPRNALESIVLEDPLDLVARVARERAGAWQVLDTRELASDGYVELLTGHDLTAELGLAHWVEAFAPRIVERGRKREASESVVDAFARALGIESAAARVAASEFCLIQDEDRRVLLSYLYQRSRAIRALFGVSEGEAPVSDDLVGSLDFERAERLRRALFVRALADPAN